MILINGINLPHQLAEIAASITEYMEPLGTVGNVL